MSFAIHLDQRNVVRNSLSLLSANSLRESLVIFFFRLPSFFCITACVSQLERNQRPFVCCFNKTRVDKEIVSFGIGNDFPVSIYL